MSDPYTRRLRESIGRAHGCVSVHVGSVTVKETSQDGTVWDGIVEVFDMKGEGETRKCYAWAYEDDAGQWQCVAMLKTPQVNTPRAAVQAFIASSRNFGAQNAEAGRGAADEAAEACESPARSADGER